MNEQIPGGTIPSLVDADRRDRRLAANVTASLDEPLRLVLFGTYEPRACGATIHVYAEGAAVVYDADVFRSEQVAELVALVLRRPVEVAAKTVAPRPVLGKAVTK